MKPLMIEKDKKITAIIGPMLGDGRCGPMCLWDSDLEHEKVDGFELDVNFDDFGEQFEIYRVTGTREELMEIQKQAQDDLDDLNGQKYIDEDGDEQTYDETCEIYFIEE